MVKPTDVLELECSVCGKKFEASSEQRLCACGEPLFARYDLKRAARTLTLKKLANRPRTLGRYADVFPDGERVTLGAWQRSLLA
jgi:threonine synthase